MDLLDIEQKDSKKLPWHYLCNYHRCGSASSSRELACSLRCSWLTLGGLGLAGPGSSATFPMSLRSKISVMELSEPQNRIVIIHHNTFPL